MADVYIVRCCGRRLDYVCSTIDLPRRIGSDNEVRRRPPTSTSATPSGRARQAFRGVRQPSSRRSNARSRSRTRARARSRSPAEPGAPRSSPPWRQGHQSGAAVERAGQGVRSRPSRPRGRRLTVPTAAASCGRLDRCPARSRLAGHCVSGGSTTGRATVVEPREPPASASRDPRSRSEQPSRRPLTRSRLAGHCVSGGSTTIRAHGGRAARAPASASRDPAAGLSNRPRDPSPGLDSPATTCPAARPPSACPAARHRRRCQQLDHRPGPRWSSRASPRRARVETPAAGLSNRPRDPSPGLDSPATTCPAARPPSACPAARPRRRVRRLDHRRRVRRLDRPSEVLAARPRQTAAPGATSASRTSSAPAGSSHPAGASREMPSTRPK